MTALAAALKKAGIVEPRDALREIAADVIASTSNLDAAREAFLSRAAAQPELVRCLFARWERIAADEYLSAAARRRSAEDRNARVEKTSLCPPPRSNHVASNIVPVVAHLRAAPGTVETPPVSVVARAATSSTNITAPSRSFLVAAQAARAPELRNYLATFMVNGIPLGQVTGMEARAWARSHKRDARFVSLMAENVPDAMRIAQARTVEEAAALYKRASEGE